MNFLSDVESLESAVGSRQLPAMLKSIDFLDHHCATLLARSPFAVLGYVDRDGRRRAAGIGGSAGFASVAGRARLAIPSVADATAGSPASTMFLIPGWREALRINGRLDAADPATLLVEEAFVHCGKAILRSGLWSDVQPRLEPTGVGASPLDPTSRAFLAASPFVVMTSVDAAGAADASPKGDPPGFVHVLGDAAVAIPDRRGNRRTDTLHNIVEDPRAAFLALVPGDDRALELRGVVRVTDDAALRRSMAMGDKVPHAVLVLEVESCALARCDAIAASRLWDRALQVPLDELPTAGQIWTDHIRANRSGGLAAAIIRAAANGTLVQAGTEAEYKRKLY
ncbi:MAG: pyridoxamine 5'-phosphate oxidase family protein [Deltaproteobacteria bacterium]|nr:pyridoxamine 5'-phosphate oxidase family protein [Deltaproteobacteria bacterium]